MPSYGMTEYKNFAVYPWVDKFTTISLGPADFDVAATSAEFSLEEILDWSSDLGDVRFTHVACSIGRYFEGGSISAVSLQVGRNGGDLDGYLEALNIHDTSEIGRRLGTRGVLLVGASSQEDFGTPNIQARIGLTGGNAEDLQEGLIHLHIYYQILKINDEST